MPCRGAAPACPTAAIVALLLALLVGQPAAAAAAAALSLDEEGAVMRTLRQGLADAGVTFDSSWQGWRPNDTLPLCSWQLVVCSSTGYVTGVQLQSDTVPPLGSKYRRSAAPLLLPKLAHFGSLRQLTLDLYYATPVAAIPAEWGLPGAFPALELLHIRCPTLEGPLLEVRPGALPNLRVLKIQAMNKTTAGGRNFSEDQRWTAAASGIGGDSAASEGAQLDTGLRAALPASWGASPDVLPALEELVLVLQLVPPLPAAWAGGFRRLRHLSIAASFDAPLPPATGNVLPAEWATGFPVLRWLNLLSLGVTGSIPAAWEQGGFPFMNQLSLTSMALSGALPEHMFEAHPNLRVLNLERNNFTGTLPAAWAAAQSLEGLSVQDNQLSGPLLPSAWLAPGALPRVKYLVLANNAALTGSLPAALPWPKLTSLSLEGTGVQLTAIPSTWCKAPTVARLDLLSLPNTSLGFQVPRCLSKAMPTLTVTTDFEVIVRDGRLVRQLPLPGGHARRVAAALVPLALLTLAGAVGLLWHRQPRRRQPICRLLQPAEASGAHFLAGTQAGRLTRPQPENPWVASGTRDRYKRAHRIESKLQSQLSQSRQRIELVPLDRLPEALTHQIGTVWRGGQYALAAAAAAGRTADYSRLQAVDEEEQQDSWRGSGSSTQGLLQAGAAGPPASRQWGLQTESLQLMPGELEMRVGTDGSLCVLGTGSSAVVYLGCLGGCEDVAVKVVELTPEMDSRHVWQEVSLLRTCMHRRLVGLLGVACQGQLLMLVMELMRGGDLHSALQRPDTCDALRWAAGGRQVALDVVEALAFLHSCGVQHADLKPSNVMLTLDLRAKLTDLGVAQLLGSRSRQAVGGTTQYAAPEQLLGLPCTTKADVYSLGVLLSVLCTGRTLVARGQLCLPTFPDDCPQAVLELIQQCIHPDPTRRPTAEEVLHRLHDS